MLIKTHNDGFIHHSAVEITPLRVYQSRRGLIRQIAGGAAGIAMASWAGRQAFWLPDRSARYPNRDPPLARALRGHNAEAHVFFRPPYPSEGVWLSMSARAMK